MSAALDARDAAIAEAVAPLFTPFECKSLHLPNRIVMAPMTRAKSPGGIPGPDVAAYYRRRAENDVGLIITEGTPVHPLGSPGRAMPDFWGDGLQGWKRVLEEVHGAGGRIVPQLWHVGMERSAEGDVHAPGQASLGPSGINREGVASASPMSENEVAEAIAAFAVAAARARELGFDGVEVHGAHGYLVDQFFWDVTNRRTDRYGGDLVERTRFATELIAAIRARVGEDFTILLRLSQWKGANYAARLVDNAADLGAFLKPLSAAGVDVFHCSTRRFGKPEFEGSDLNFAGWVRQLTGKPTITVGSVGIDADFNARAQQNSDPHPVDEVATRLAAGEFDLVAVGRALITDYAWARKIREGRFDELQGFRRETLLDLL